MSPTAKTPSPIHSDQTASAAFAAILRHDFDRLLTWQVAARDWQDIEGVHQLRVGFRRMRSALSLFRGAVPREATATRGEEMRWIAGELGPARDLDVFIAEGLGPVTERLPLPGAEQLLQLAETRRAEVYRERVVTMLDSDRFRHFCAELPDWIDARGWEQEPLTAKQSKRLHTRIVGFSRRLLDKQHRRVLEAGGHVDRDNTTELHRLRIECKKLRYATEFFQPLFNGMTGFIDHMKGLQDLLGVMNDVAVTRHLLDDLLAGKGDRDLNVYAGGLIGWRSCEFHHLLLRFDDNWEELVAAKPPWWTKQSRGH